jgi:hypothetical protein
MLKSKCLSKDQSNQALKSKLEDKTEEISIYKQQIEKLNKTIKDMALQQKLTIAFNQENIVKKTKQL